MGRSSVRGFFLAALLVGGPASAAEDSAALARRYLDATGTADLTMGLMGCWREPAIPIYEGAAVLQASLDAAVKTFTSDELAALAGFFSTPTGRSIGEKMPAFAFARDELLRARVDCLQSPP